MWGLIRRSETEKSEKRNIFGYPNVRLNRRFSKSRFSIKIMGVKNFSRTDNKAYRTEISAQTKENKTRGLMKNEQQEECEERVYSFVRS